jgi:transcriptional regulator with XRE-family HTH domain
LRNEHARPEETPVASKRQNASLKKALKSQGRTVTWLAEETGYSRGYVSHVLNGQIALTEEFQAKALEALSTGATVPVTYKGRRVAVPESIYKEAANLSPLVVQSTFEEAWKASWVQEHGAEALAVAAERAFAVASATK